MLFKHYDKDRSESISFGEFKDIFMSNKIAITEDEIQDMFNEIDENQDAGISIDEFTDFVKKHEGNCEADK